MPNSRFYSSIAAVTNLQVTASPSDASIQVASSSGFPGSFPFTLSLDYGSANEELVQVESGGPSIFTVTRAVDGTSASTHNAGAVVRHVSSARDFTDSRTHEASTTGVHGISGQFVDTVSVQTLSNKTLTAPVINNAALAGTFSGTPTFSGVVIYNGGPTFTTTPPSFVGASSTSTVERVLVGGDPNDRWQIKASGAMEWGPGSAVRDTNLYRSAINTLQTDDTFVQLGENQAIRTAASDVAYRATVGGDSISRFTVGADGKLSWSTGAVAPDVSMSRSAAGVLTVAGTLAATSVTATAGITATGALTGSDLTLTNQAFTTFTPVWHGTDASMSTNVGWYARYGKMIHYEIYTVFSTSSSLTGSVSVDLPTVPYRSGTRQQLGTMWFTDLDTTGSWLDNNGMGHHGTFAGDSGTSTAALRNYRDNILTGGQIKGPSPSTIITINGTYREA